MTNKEQNLTHNFGKTEEKFINYIMKGGKKSVARRIFANTLTRIQALKTDQDPTKLFFKAIENAKPTMEVKPKRVGGSIYQVPREVSPHRQQMLAFRWLLDAARNNKGAAMEIRLANELIQASENAGSAIKKKDDTHKMAQANKAFAHFAKY